MRVDFVKVRESSVVIVRVLWAFVSAKVNGITLSKSYVGEYSRLSWQEVGNTVPKLMREQVRLFVTQQIEASSCR